MTVKCPSSNPNHVVLEEELQAIEVNTRQQKKDKTWHKERQMRLTASNFGRIVKSTDRCDKEKLARSMITPRPLNSDHIPALNHGIRYESVAIEKYSELNGICVQPCGLFVSADRPYLAATPDGIIDDTHLIEVKCPFSAKDSSISPNTVSFLSADGTLDMNHNYYYQIQGQLYCADRQYCTFIIFTLNDMKCLRIDRNDVFIGEMLKKLENFHIDYHKPQILEKFLYKEYNRYSFSEK